MYNVWEGEKRKKEKEGRLGQEQWPLQSRALHFATTYSAQFIKGKKKKREKEKKGGGGGERERGTWAATDGRSSDWCADRNHFLLLHTERKRKGEKRKKKKGAPKGGY